MIDFNELIDNYLQREVFPRSVGRYWPSEAGGCLRKTWFTFRIPKEVEKPLSRIFEMGNRVHDLIADVIQSEKNKHVKLIDRELPVKIQRPEYIVSGKIDDLILVVVDGTKHLVEVKSVKYLPGEPRSEHLMQLQLYMHSTEVHNGIMLYVKKDDFQIKQFEVNYDEKSVRDILARFDKLHKHLVEDKIPGPEAKLIEEKNWMCSFCPYVKECDEAGGVLRDDDA
ncbi:PD-(D/E)XK nuclease family protein [Candidatus Pacearchaeota archaeon]|nr:PD-(D/E)XK nuclease family protein [Candidatus Pacearchaeota archaeon]